MIAQIIPIARMPAGMHQFDYIVPPALQEDLCIGQLVVIPLRKSDSYGVVQSIEPEANVTSRTYQLKEIQAIAVHSPILSKAHLHQYVILSKWYGVSLGTILKMALLPMQKRKLQDVTCLDSTHKKGTGTFQAFQYAEPAERIQTIHAAVAKEGQTLILLPTEKAVQHLAEELAVLEPIVWHSKLSVKEQFTHWIKIRNGESTCIIGTKSAMMLPFFNITSIIIDEEHSEHYKSWEQQPLYDARDIAWLMHSIFGVHVLRMSYSLSLEAYAQQSVTLPSLSEHAAQMHIIDMRSAGSAKEYAPLSPSVQSQILESSGAIFLYHNRRGYASSLSCQDCGHVQSCPHCDTAFVYYASDNTLRCHYCKRQGTITSICPACSSDYVRLRGSGTEHLVEYVGSLHPSCAKRIIRIDSDVDESENIPHTDQPIIIGTQKALALLPWKELSSIIFVDIDKDLSLPEFMAGEQLWHTLAQMRYKLPAEATVSIQTKIPEHSLLQSLQDQQAWYTSELKLRHSLGYPPYCFAVRYLFGDRNKKTALELAKKQHSQLIQALTNHGLSITLSDPYQILPLRYKGMTWYAILARIPHENWMNDVLQLNAYIGHKWRIDPHPQTIIGYS